MRSEQEVMDLILDVARADERIRAVLLVGSRANPAVPKDIYQDYDITYFVEDITPFYNNPAWIEEHFGKPLIMQMPEIMRDPDGDGHFTYLIIFPDGVRIDLSFDFRKYIDDGEPAIVLLDKDNGLGFLPVLPAPSDKFWHIIPPSPLDYYSCCNNFWWCLNNVAKGIARDELPYVMHMLNDEVRSDLHEMINYYIGTRHGFDVSTGKDGKYFKKYLMPELYEQYAATYSGSDYTDIWAAVDAMCDLFHILASAVAEHFGFNYRLNEEAGIREYLKIVRSLSKVDFSNKIGFRIEELTPANRKEADQVIREEWAGPLSVSRGRVWDTSVLPGFAAFNEDKFCGAVTYRIEGDECEIVTLNSLQERKGIGSALINAVIDTARENNCRRMWLITTNDNTHAIRFYQRFGFALRAVHINAMEESRKLKPSIPLTGNDNIPILHEFEFEILL